MEYTHLLLFYTCYAQIYNAPKNYQTLTDIVFTESEQPNEPDVNSVYWFGSGCSKKNKYLVDIHKYTTDELQGQESHEIEKYKSLFTGYLRAATIPDCVLIKSRSSVIDHSVYSSHNFRLCVIAIVYLYGAEKTLLVRYEWYIPQGLEPGVSWELSFFEVNQTLSEEEETERTPVEMEMQIY